MYVPQSAGEWPQREVICSLRDSKFNLPIQEGALTRETRKTVDYRLTPAPISSSKNALFSRYAYVRLMSC